MTTTIEVNPSLPPPSSPDPERGTIEWEDYPLRAFVEDGVMFEVNRKLLWDLGLTLAVEKEGESYTGLRVMTTKPAMRILDTDPDNSRWRRFQRFLSDRAGRVSP